MHSASVVCGYCGYVSYLQVRKELDSNLEAYQTFLPDDVYRAGQDELRSSLPTLIRARTTKLEIMMYRASMQITTDKDKLRNVISTQVAAFARDTKDYSGDKASDAADNVWKNLWDFVQAQMA